MSVYLNSLMDISLQGRQVCSLTRFARETPPKKTGGLFFGLEGDSFKEAEKEGRERVSSLPFKALPSEKTALVERPLRFLNGLLTFS